MSSAEQHPQRETKDQSPLRGMDGLMSEAQIEFALKASRVGIWNWNLCSGQLIWTDQCRALFGLPPGYAISHERFLAAVHPDDRARVAAIAERSLAEHTEFRTSYRTIWPDGSAHWLTDSGQAVYDAQGKPTQMIGAIMDITDLERTEEALRESEWRFRRLVDSNIIGITIDDLDGNVREANDAFLALVGYTREDLEAGQLRWTTLTAPGFEEQNKRAVEELLATGSFAPIEIEYVTREGKRVPVLVGGTILRRDGERLLEIAFVVDLTARKEIEQQKDFFLGMTSHELKTPLTALKGTLQLLQKRMERLVNRIDHRSSEEEAFGRELARGLETALRQVDVQTRLINDLLDISRITSNTLELSMHRYNLIRILREAINDLRLTAPERALVLEPPEHETIPILADRDRISQVIANYVTNALRYSPPDRPIYVGLVVQEDAARVWVRDEGPGLSVEEQKDLWQRFQKIKGRKDAGKGLGLGLYICRTLITQHKGTVGVESTPGKGSTFWFSLPISK